MFHNIGGGSTISTSSTTSNSPGETTNHGFDLINHAIRVGSVNNQVIFSQQQQQQQQKNEQQQHLQDLLRVHYLATTPSNTSTTSTTAAAAAANAAASFIESLTSAGTTPTSSSITTTAAAALTPSSSSTAAAVAAAAFSAAIHHHHQQQQQQRQQQQQQQPHQQQPTQAASSLLMPRPSLTGGAHTSTVVATAAPTSHPASDAVAIAAAAMANLAPTTVMMGNSSHNIGIDQRPQHQHQQNHDKAINPNSFQFPWKLHDMLDRASEEKFEDVVSWEDNGRSFKVHVPSTFVEVVMPVFFKQTKYKSFQRQLNLYGFSRINDGSSKGGYQHRFFLRGQRGLCQLISRSMALDTTTTAAAAAAATTATTATTSDPSPPPLPGDHPHFHRQHQYHPTETATAILDRLIWSAATTGTTAPSIESSAGSIVHPSGPSLSPPTSQGGGGILSSSTSLLSSPPPPTSIVMSTLSVPTAPTISSSAMNVSSAVEEALSRSNVPFSFSTAPTTSSLVGTTSVTGTTTADGVPPTAIVVPTPHVGVEVTTNGGPSPMTTPPSSSVYNVGLMNVVGRGIELSEQERMSILHKEFQFPWKLFEMLERSVSDRFDDVVSWVPPSNTSFKVHNAEAFVRDVMPRFFKQSKYKSFQRQLNLYGFVRVDEGHNKGAYRHTYFWKGRKDLLNKLTRVKIKGATNNNNSISNNNNNNNSKKSRMGAPSIADLRTPDRTTTTRPAVTPQTAIASEDVTINNTMPLLPTSLNSPATTKTIFDSGSSHRVAVVSSSPVQNDSVFSNPTTTFQRRNSGIDVILEAIMARERSSLVSTENAGDMAENASATSSFDHPHCSGTTSGTVTGPVTDTAGDHMVGRSKNACADDTVMTDPSADAIPADRISWRRNPSESMSDWTIQVIQSSAFDETKCIITPYHVHRKVLTVGQNRSQYFAELFKENKTTNNTSQLNLSTAHASVFPMVLDHMYNQSPLVLDAVTAYSLYSLAEKLGMPSILQATTDFYRQRMNSDNVIDFIKLGQSFQDKSLLDAAISTCSGEMKFTGFQVCAKLDPEIMYRVMIRHNELPRSMKCGSSQLSQLVAICVSNATRATLSLETFKLLTNEEMLPCIESTAAITLLATENSLLNDSQGSPTLGAQSLRTRCVTSIIQDWDSLRNELEHNFELSKAMKSISSSVLFDILMKTKTCSSNVSDSSSASASENDERVTAV